ncbi:VaFE repeat-containing surface-anchored protein, partial [Enterococcus faecalis]|nr:VaFE repeat-containing surface-anchored protein [Enterococcus faecalis]
KKHEIRHENPADKAQTIVTTPEVPKEKELQISKVNLGGEEIPGAEIEIKQGDKVVEAWTSKKDVSQKVDLLPGTYVFHEKVAPKGYIAVTDITFTVNEDGTVTVTNVNGNTVKTEGNKLVVTDQAEYVNPQKGTLRTTVKADNVLSSATKPVEVTSEQVKSGISVVDTISYTGLVPEKSYTVTGNLYEVKDGKVVGAAKATQTEKFVASKEGSGTWDLDFGKVAGLEAGKTYVVYEMAVSDENLVDSDKNNIPD